MAGPKTQKEIAMKKGDKKTKEKISEDKQNKLPRQTAIAVDHSNKQSTTTSETLKKDIHANSTPKTKQKAKLKTIDSQTRPEDILDTFQNRNLHRLSGRILQTIF